MLHFSQIPKSSLPPPCYLTINSLEEELERLIKFALKDQNNKGTYLCIHERKVAQS